MSEHTLKNWEAEQLKKNELFEHIKKVRQIVTRNHAYMGMELDGSEALQLIWTWHKCELRNISEQRAELLEVCKRLSIAFGEESLFVWGEDDEEKVKGILNSLDAAIAKAEGTHA